MTLSQHDDTLEVPVIDPSDPGPDEGYVGAGPVRSGRHSDIGRRLARRLGGRRPDVNRVLEVAGKVLAALTVLFLTFAAYSVIATGWVQHRDQTHLQASFGKVVTLAKAGGASSGGFFARHGAAPARPPTSPAVAMLRIPALNLTQAVLDGVTPANLAEGPALYRGSGAIGAKGNVDIAGHRTLDGAPFYHLDRLQRGDQIILSTATGQYTYTVVTINVVHPGQRSALEDFGDHRLTLTTGDPVFSVSHPLVVESLLTASQQWPKPASTPVPRRSDPLFPEVSGSKGAWLLVLLGGGLAVAAWGAQSTVRRRWPDRADVRAGWALAGPVLIAGVFISFHALTEILPATI